MDGRRVGVRWNRRGLDARLRNVTRSAIGVGDAPPNVSVVVGEDSGQTRTKHHLYLQGEVMSPGSGDGGLVRAVLRAIATLFADPPADTIWMRALLVIGPGGLVYVIDRRLTDLLRRMEPRLRRSGHCVLALPGIHVRPQTGTAVLPDCAGILGVSLDDLEQEWPQQGTDDDLRSGEMQIARLVYRGFAEPPSRAAGIADMVPMLWDAGGWVRTGDVAQLVRLTDTVETIGVPGQDAGALRSALGLDRL